jgi:CDP-ribitol ribitolphosphotransferase
VNDRDYADLVTLTLDRPTIFLDVPPPFKKGFSLDESYHFGKIVSNMSEMIEVLRLYLLNPEAYFREYQKKIDRVKSGIYDSTADRRVGERCLSRTQALY